MKKTIVSCEASLKGLLLPCRPQMRVQWMKIKLWKKGPLKEYSKQGETFGSTIEVGWGITSMFD